MNTTQDDIFKIDYDFDDAEEAGPLHAARHIARHDDDGKGCGSLGRQPEQNEEQSVGSQDLRHDIEDDAHDFKRLNNKKRRLDSGLLFMRDDGMNVTR